MVVPSRCTVLHVLFMKFIASKLKDRAEHKCASRFMAPVRIMDRKEPVYQFRDVLIRDPRICTSGLRIRILLFLQWLSRCNPKNKFFLKVFLPSTVFTVGNLHQSSKITVPLTF
jgi:hypothetical protein